MSELASLTALYEATRRIGLRESLSDLVDEVLVRARELIGFEHAALMLYDPDRKVLSVERARGYGARREEILELSLPLGEGISGWAAEHRKAVRVGDVRQDPRYVEGLEKARSNMAVPLMVGNEVAGVINVESERYHAFTEEHEKLLTVLGAQAALAILAAKARKRLRERIDVLDALHRISRLASQQQEGLEETLTEILEIARQVAPEGQVAILLREEDRDVLRVRAAAGYAEGVHDLEIPLGRGISGRCAELGETLVVDDVRESEDYIPGVPDGRSEIAIPLMVEGEVIGVLDAESPRPAAFGEDEERTLSAIAHQIAAVVHSVRLYEESRRLAVTDPLTGLHNRRHFFSRLEKHLARARRYDESLALILLDCDNLKEINDRHGHLTGDEALVQIGRLLRASLRASDEVARVGGDEFGTLLLKADPALTKEVLERIHLEAQAIELATEDGRPVEISISAGAAFYPIHGDTAKELVSRADEALYASKGAGRSQLVIYADDLSAGRGER